MRSRTAFLLVALTALLCAGELAATAPPVAAASPVPVTYRVFATQYAPTVEGSFEVAVPDKCAKFAALGQTAVLANLGCPSGYAVGLDYRVVVTRDSGQSATIPVKDAGPWNIDDNYWEGGPRSPRPRRLFGDLPRGMPEAQAAFQQGYNSVSNCDALDGSPTGHPGGADQFGRCVLNPAGIDLSFAAVSRLGMVDNEWVDVTFLWSSAGPGSPPPPSAGSKPGVARQGAWYLRQSRTTGRADLSYAFGDRTDLAVMGDWDGNGTRTPGVFRNGTWYLRNSNSTGVADVALGFGDAGDLPVVGDWNGDGVDTPGVFRKGVWYLRNSNRTGVADLTFGFGNPGDLPVAGDWNGNRADTPGVVRQGRWFLRNSNRTGVADLAFAFGNPGDRPVAGDWNGDGADTPGVFRGGNWYLRNSNTTGPGDVSFGFGNSGDVPLIWR